MLQYNVHIRRQLSIGYVFYLHKSAAAFESCWALEEFWALADRDGWVRAAIAAKFCTVIWGSIPAAAAAAAVSWADWALIAGKKAKLVFYMFFVSKWGVDWGQMNLECNRVIRSRMLISIELLSSLVFWDCSSLPGCIRASIIVFHGRVHVGFHAKFKGNEL